jgi:hypothetical protein
MVGFTMNELVDVPLSDKEQRLGLRSHKAVDEIQPPLEDFGKCLKCGDPLVKKNRDGIHQVCRLLQNTRVDQRYKLFDAVAEAKDPSTIESTKWNPEMELFCKWCKNITGQFKLTSPACFPINVVAVTCVCCGEVAGYFDEMLSPEFIESKYEMPSRQSTISHRNYKPDTSRDEKRQLVVQGLRLGLEEEQIAYDLSVSVMYVHSVGVNEGLVQAYYQAIDTAGHRRPGRSADARGSHFLDSSSILEKYSAGISVTTIARELGVSIPAIRYHIKKARQ